MQTDRKVYRDVPESADFVMYWWHKAAKLAMERKIRQFGFITTNSITQIFNRKVTGKFLRADPPLHLIYAVPDHPWVDNGAAVRIAMTVAGAENKDGVLQTVISETESGKLEYLVELESKTGTINPNLTIGADVTQAQPLQANSGLSSQGMKLHGHGFIVTQAEAITLGLGKIKGLEKYIRPILNGKDITARSRNVMVIDLYGLEIDFVLKHFPAVYQWVIEHVKSEREVNKRASYREKWWIFGEPRKELRPALYGLSRYIVTPQTAKHRFFIFLDSSTIPESALSCIALADAFYLGVLSSRIHVCWALAAGGTLENRPTYNKSVCFDPFPFPYSPHELRKEIADLAEAIDRHRKEHNSATITEMYNVLQALREGRPLSKKEQEINAKALVSVLDELHKRLDAAVFKAYGWSEELSDEQILSRLVALNGERGREEKTGKIRWLRPEYQAKQIEKRETLAIPQNQERNIEKKQSWPATLKDQFQVVQEVIQTLQNHNIAICLESIAPMFSSQRHKKRIAEILEILEQQGLI